MRIATRASTWTGMLLLPLLLGTTECGDAPSAPGFVFEVGLVNDADAPIHILEPRSDFSSGNRIAPGDARTVEIAADDGERLRFRAGRNGEVLIATDCFLDASDATKGGKLVVYDENRNGLSSLTCVNW